MGDYTDNLFKKNRKKSSGSKINFVLEDEEPIVTDMRQPTLVSVAIIREGNLHHGFKSHVELRRSLGYKDPYASDPKDQEGFYTSDDRFVTRREAMFIAIEAGQIDPLYGRMERDFLSSDIW